MAHWRDFAQTPEQLAAWFLGKVAPTYTPAALVIVFDDLDAVRGRLAGWVEGNPTGFTIHVGTFLDLDQMFYALLHEMGHILRGDVRPDASPIEDPAVLRLQRVLLARIAEEYAGERADMESECDRFALEEFRAWDAANL